MALKKDELSSIFFSATPNEITSRFETIYIQFKIILIIISDNIVKSFLILFKIIVKLPLFKIPLFTINIPINWFHSKYC